MMSENKARLEKQPEILESTAKLHAIHTESERKDSGEQSEIEKKKRTGKIESSNNTLWHAVQDIHDD